MRPFLPFLALLPCGLLAQTVSELAPLEYQPAGEASAHRTIRKPPSFELQLPAPERHRLGALRQAEIDAVERDPRLPLRGVERAVERHSVTRGEWVTLADESLAWRLSIQSEGAWALRVEFTRFNVGPGEVWIYSEDHTQVYGPYSGTGPGESGEFWSHIVFGDSVVVEYRPDRPRSDTPFAVSKVAHVLPEQEAMAAGSCELDVSCYSDWGSNASGVGMFFFQKGSATYACSGALLNNTNKDGKPYFLTANHCISDAASAKTVDVFWKYQTPACNGKAPALSTLPQSLGAIWLASGAIAVGDYSLMQLSSVPNLNLTFYGWNSSTTGLQVGDATVGVHHPSADYTRIAFGVRDPDMNVYVGSEYAPGTMYYQVRETAGRIEPGSSGSPLFTSAKVLVGTLTYGPGGDACSISPFSAGYGRFSAAYPSMSQWLTPPASGGSGGATTPGTTTPATITTTPAALQASWTIGTTPPSGQNIQITTTSTTAVSLMVQSTATWIVPSATTLSVKQAAPASLAIGFNLASLTAAGAYSGSVTISGTGIQKSVTVQVTVAAPATAVKGGPLTVIPLWLDGGGSATTFTLVNPYGTATVASISFASSSGAAMPVPVGTASTAWQNLTIPGFGTATVVTAGTSTPQKSGMAIVQTSDPAKRLEAWAQVNGDYVSPVQVVTLPLIVPFDATGTAASTLYLYNPATSGTLLVNLYTYDSAGKVTATGQASMTGQSQGVIAMTKTSSMFAGKKGILYVTGAGTVWAMGLRTAADGRISAFPPQGQ